jgi:hypothetical protein
MHASFVGNGPPAFTDRKSLRLQVEQVYSLSSCLPRTLILVACMFSANVMLQHTSVATVGEWVK